MPLKKVIFLLLFLATSFLSFGQSSASRQVKIFDIEAPQLDTVRTIRIYLPVGYETTDDKYPVLYMHDAQNLFDTATAFSGEWQVDEFLEGQKGQKVIVVGVDQGNEKRIAELTPFPHEKYGGGDAAAYVDFIRETLKPHVDATYRTLTAAENTAVMGSSLGGLVSLYAAVKYPEVFGMAGVFSPSFWFSEEIYGFTEASEINKDARFYFLGGTSEDKTLVGNIKKMNVLLLKKGLSEEKILVKIVEGGEHNEAFWSSEFPEAFKWLFPENAAEK